MPLSKITRSAEKQAIHNIFIFNKSGICLYGRNFTNSYKMEDNLISSFFSALMSFTKQVLGKKIRTVELGDVKFVIIEKNKFFYGLLCNSIENLLLLEDIITKLNTQFRLYVQKLKINTDIEQVYDDELHQIVDEIVKDSLTSIYDLQKEKLIIDKLKEVYLEEDIEGVVLLTDKGKVIYSSLNGDVSSRNLLKEVDFRVKICNNSILKLFYTSKNNQLIFSEYIEDLYFLILVFDLRIRFGVAEYYLKKIVKTIQDILNN